MSSFEEWLHRNPPPTLADLLVTYGQYSAIPASAWREHEQALEHWRARCRERHREK